MKIEQQCRNGYPDIRTFMTLRMAAGLIGDSVHPADGPGFLL
jgi:hypothetical protein